MPNRPQQVSALLEHHLAAFRFASDQDSSNSQAINNLYTLLDQWPRKNVEIALEEDSLEGFANGLEAAMEQLVPVEGHDRSTLREGIEAIRSRVAQQNAPSRLLGQLTAAEQANAR